jgi:hypothetical protein
VKAEGLPIEYLAGFFDGEGSICITGMGTKRKGAARLAVRCQVSNTNEVIVREFQRRWGGTVAERRQPAGSRRQWGWSISHRAGRAFLDELVPHLFVKRRQAEIARRFWLTCRVGVSITDEVAAEREALRIELSDLNHGRSSA